jgi:multidrug efflux system membrane fusion protein
VPVTVAPVESMTVPVQITAIGNVEASSTVAVKARVTGELKRVHFKEGQDVAQGALLFSVDALPYEVELRKAEADLARSQALAKKAEEDLRRYQELVKKDYISREQYDQAVTNLDALRAQVKADQALVESARLQLEYCSIRAPISGRTGLLQVDEGNTVRANDEMPLVVINRIQPVFCTFAVPEQDLARIKRYAGQGRLKVEARIPGAEDRPEEGTLSFIDQSIDKSTGTIRLRGVFPNREKRLWPGQFVNLTLTLYQRPDALVVPSQAVQTGMKGEYVFVVKAEMKAEHRPVLTGPSLNGKTVVEQGLAKGEWVVTDGQFRLFPGAKVQIKNAKAAPAKGEARP